MESPRGLLRRRGGRVSGRAGLVRRDVPGVPPRHLHHPGPDEAGQPSQRAPAARGRALGRPPPPSAGGATTRTTSSSGSGSTVLLHQFHDILPGSSIAWVHREARARRTPRGRPNWSARSPTGPPALAGPGRRRVALQRGPYAAATASPALGGGVAATAEGGDGGGHARPAAASSSTTGCSGSSSMPRPGRLGARPAAPAGRSIAPGAAGNLAAAAPRHPEPLGRLGRRRALPPHGDRPRRRGRGRGRRRASRRWSGGGPRRPAFGASAIEQLLTLARRAAPGRDRHATVDWHERQKLLKLAFPLDVHADRSASEIQFGHVHRPTHTNTSWDAARFEICAHRWVHVGEPGYGVAVANDATYGHDVSRATRDRAAGRRRRSGCRCCGPRCSRIRRPTRAGTACAALVAPGADIADAVARGLPHEPAAPHGARRQRPVAPLVAVDDPRPWWSRRSSWPRTGRGDVVVRLYEAYGGRAHARPHARLPVAGRRDRPARTADRQGPRRGHAFRPFQIRTIKFLPRRH